MEQQEKPKKKSTFSKVFNPITTLWKKQPHGSTIIPTNMQDQITYFLNINPNAQSFEVAVSSINSLAQQDKEANQLLNDPVLCLELIKQLAQKFKCSDQEITEALQTKEAQRRWDIQHKLYQLCTFEAELPSLESLINLGVDLEFTYKYYTFGSYRTPLMLASMIKSPMLQKLCTHTDKFDINRRDTEGETALMLAAQEGLLNNVKTLLDAGANPVIPDNNGLTPLQAAEESGRQEVVNLIKNAMK